MIPAEYAIVAIIFIGLFMSVVIHEVAHAVAALWFGDDTAQRMGRITLDPLPHIDPFMTIILPALLLWTTGGKVAFGGAKPVPVNPLRLRNPKHDMMWIAAAGPISNVLIAIVLAISLNVWPLLSHWDRDFAVSAVIILQRLSFINLLLAAFNMLPVPPLDGSKVLAAFLPDRTAESYLQMGQRFGLILVMLLVFSGSISQMLAPVSQVFGVLVNFVWVFHP